MMRVSVVVCEHTMERYADVEEAVESLFDQTYDDVEIVLVSDGNEIVCEHFEANYGDRDGMVLCCLEENVGLLAARNAGAKAASGDVVAFMDDDAIADEEWIAELVAVYEEWDVPAVGGKMVPEWIAGKPSFLPEEFYWLVGVTHRGFADGPAEVRNTFGSNISFKREVFLDLGGFDTEVGGRQGDANLQGGETELCARMGEEYGHGVYYTPEAEVAHKIFDYRTSPVWLLDRAFWQGYSKRAMETIVPESTGAESAFLKHLLTRGMPRRLRQLVTGPRVIAAIQLAMLLVLTAAVGLGYGYGFVRYR